MQGLHLTADLYQCRCEAGWLEDALRLEGWCLQAVRAVGLEPLQALFRANAGGGVSAAVLLAGGGHVGLHTWPAQRAATLDVYACNDGSDPSARARGLLEALVRRFQPEWTEQRSLDRGQES